MQRVRRIVRRVVDWLRRERTRDAWERLWPALVVYSLVALVITWPLARQIDTHAAGAGWGDSSEVLRQSWWAREQLLHGRFPFEQSLLLYPNGWTSWLQWSQWMQYAPSTLLMLVFDPLTAFNLSLLITLVLNGTAAYWLGMHLSGRHRMAALLAGLVFMAFPAAQGHLSVGHFGNLILWPVALFALCWWRVLREGAGWRVVGWGGVWFALSALAHATQITFVLFPIVLFFGLYGIVWDRGRLMRRGASLFNQPWARGAAMVLWGGLLLVPFYAPLLTDDGRREVEQLREPGRVAYSTDLLAFVSPSPFGPLDDAGLVPGYAREVLGTNSAEGSAYLGLVAVGLAILALVRRESARVWLVVGLGAMLFSLGPLLKWRDVPVEVSFDDIHSYVTLPWTLFQDLPVFEATRTPGRFNLATGLALSAMVAVGGRVLSEQVRRRSMRVAVMTALGVLVMVEYQLFSPFLTSVAEEPPYLETLAHMDNVRAVLSVPVLDNVAAKSALYQQTIHHQPLIAGHTLRRTLQDPALLAVLDRATQPPTNDGLPPLRPADVSYLLWNAGADRVIVQKKLVPDAPAALTWLITALGSPEYEDDLIAAFAVPRTPEPPPGFLVVMAASVDGWTGLVNMGLFEGRFLTGPGSWYLYTATEQYGELFFQAAPYGAMQRVGVWLDDHLIDGFYAQDEIVRLPLRLSAGYHTLRLEPLDGCDPYPFELSCWALPSLAGACVRLEQPLCLSLVVGSPEWKSSGAALTPLDVSLYGGLRLRAYDVSLNERADTVTVRLFWEADGPLSGRYALFVHLADPVSGQPYTQYDGYPVVSTDQWGKGTRWQSTVQIAWPDPSPAGDVALNVGWFRPDDNVRLGVLGDRPWAEAGIIFLDILALEPGS